MSIKDFHLIIKVLLVIIIVIPFYCCSDDLVEPGDDNKDGLEYINPENAGYSSAKLEEAKQFAVTSGFDAVMALHDGKVIFSWGKINENYWLHSIRKPMLSSRNSVLPMD